MAIVSNVVSNSSNIAICKSFEQVIKKHIPQKRWIGTNNFYGKDTVHRTDHTTLANVKTHQLSEYIATSTILHCYDGWNFVSRGIESILSNDIATAIHMLYYAELRAVMSFMAYQGVGIFNKKHFWFDSARHCGIVEQLNSHGNPTHRISTHQLAAKCLSEIGNLNNRKDIFFDLIRVSNKKLTSWVNASSFTTRSGYSTEIIKRWLKDWSIDLKLNDDQQLRNETSYRPQFSSNYLDIRASVEKLNLIWQAIEPTESSRFNIIDLHLSRIALERIFSKSTGQSPSTAKGKPSFISFIDKIFDRIGGEVKGQSLYNFFIRNIEPNDHFVLVEARKHLNNNNHLNLGDPFPMLCRSVLLMRLSSGCVYELIDNSTLDKKDLRYWWEDICNNIGISAALDDDINPIDLYTDIKEAFDEISQASGNGSLNSLYSGLSNVSTEFNIVKQFQRACFWGVGL